MNTPEHIIFTDSVIGVGCARVVDAVQKATNQQRVAKLLDLHHPVRREANLSAFYNETQILRHLHTIPNDCIIRLEESCIINNTAVVILERMDGDLLDLILSGQLDVHQRLSIFYQVCLAAQFCHDNNIAHLDLKPDNILCSLEPAAVKLTDFGTSQEMQHGRVFNVHGTLYYNAPEVLQQDRTGVDGVKADIWSLGITLHVLLSGTWPISSEDPEEIRALMSSGRLSFSECLTKDQFRFLSRLLQFNPVNRPTLQQILESEFLRPYAPKVGSENARKKSAPRRILHWFSSSRVK